MIPLAAITDEFSPDLNVALQAMSEAAIRGVELRLIGTKNVVELTNDEIDDVRARVDAHGMRVVSIASPLLKCVLPGAPPLDARVQHDVFGSSYTIDDQPQLAERAFEAAARTGAGIIRVFSYWRTAEPERCLDRIVSALRELADQAAGRHVAIGLENEHACNIGTGTELGQLLAALDHPNLGAIWDPANALVLGETPYPDGYSRLPVNRILHVHAKDCVVQDYTPTWGLIGEMGIDWAGQIAALARDGYRGWISLETHWRGPTGDRLEASRISALKLAELSRVGAL